MVDDFFLLKRYVEQTLKIQCSNYKEDYIKRRFLSRLRYTNTANYTEYLSYLRHHPEELELLRNALTINVTEFFRDEEVYQSVRRIILPAIIERRKRVLIWSAGCATGEEPYSLAIILAEMMAANREISGKIIATDIDEVVLAKAKAGVFPEKSVRKLSRKQIGQFFSRLPEGDYAANQLLKDLIRFSPHDLMSGTPPARFLDLVTCRNVTIYFTEAQKNELVRLVHSSLASGGYYVMGKTEYLGREIESLFTPVDSIQKIYQKRDR